jgi:hypothetical protein
MELKKAAQKINNLEKPPIIADGCASTLPTNHPTVSLSE